MTHRLIFFLGVLVIGFVLSLSSPAGIWGCGSSSDDEADDDDAADDDATDDDTADDDTDDGGTFTLTSSSMPAGQNMADEHYLTDAGCAPGAAGSNISPEISWTSGPTTLDGTTVGSFALTMLDLDCTDATDCPGQAGPFVHWIVYNITPAASGSIGEGDGTTGTIGAESGPNDFAPDPPADYGGPCPPANVAHTYEFKLWALTIGDLENDTQIGADLAAGTAAAQDVVDAIERHNSGFSAGSTASITREAVGGE